MTDPSPVFYFDGADPEMRTANERALATFRYFWREVAWERRRIIPGLDLAAIKAPFADGDLAAEGAEIEHMWITDVNFDGRDVTGTLLNSPAGLTSVKEGDHVRIPLGLIGDWMYVVGGKVYGAYTVNVLRSRMDPRERREHDTAWGLDFGDPWKIRLNPWGDGPRGLLRRWFGPRHDEQAVPGEHPMSVAMAPSLKEQIAADPSLISARDDEGWTFLHSEALAGSLPTVQVLLDAGSDPNAKTNHGMTPVQLARSLGWEDVVALLTRR